MRCEPESAHLARRLVEEKLVAWSLPGLVDVAELLVSELVGNAVRHTGCQMLGVSVRLANGSVRVSVRDSSRSLPVVIHAGSSEESGRGLALIGMLADSWGVKEVPFGKIVWVDLAAPAIREPVCKQGELTLTEMDPVQQRTADGLREFPDGGEPVFLERLGLAQ